MQLDPQMLEKMKDVILPEILYVAEKALSLQVIIDKANEEEIFDNWCLGCICWRMLFNRFKIVLQDNSFFKINIIRNMMEITCPNWDKFFTFYIYRVHEDSRIPKGAKSVKAYLQEQLWLSDELKANMENRSNGINLIGYDITIQNGLGAISLDRLCAIGKHNFECIPLYNFGQPELFVSKHIPVTETDYKLSISTEPEEITKPAVNKENSSAQTAYNEK